MAVPAYAYIPMWGMEPWKAVEGKNFLNPDGTGPTSEANAQFGGGAELTNENLIVGLWTATAFDAFSRPVAGAQLKPSDAFSEGLSGLPPGVVGNANLFFGGTQPRNSRTSAKFFVSQGLSDAWDPTNFFAVVNPPDSFKSRMYDLYDFTFSPNAFSDYMITMKKQLASEGQWHMMAYAEAGGGGLTTPVIPVADPAAFQGVVFSGSSAVSTSLFAPFSFFLRTNGADGEFPEFYGDLDAASLKPILDSGDYYLMAQMAFDDTLLPNGVTVELAWPHSVAR